MKKRMVCLVVFGTLLMIFVLAGCSQNRAIQWKDPVVESAIREYLGKPEGDIFPEDVADISTITFVGNDGFINTPFVNVTTMSVRDPNAIFNVDTGASRTNQGSNPSTITTLADFAHFANLEELALYDMSFSKLEGIGELTKNQKLHSFHLSFDSNLTTLEGIGKLTQLTKLRLVGLPVTDLSELEKLTALTVLETSDVLMDNISYMQKLENLEMLYAYQVPVLEWQKSLDALNVKNYEVQMVDGTTLEYLAQ